MSTHGKRPFLGSLDGSAVPVNASEPTMPATWTPVMAASTPSVTATPPGCMRASESEFPENRTIAAPQLSGANAYACIRHPGGKAGSPAGVRTTATPAETLALAEYVDHAARVAADGGPTLLAAAAGGVKYTKMASHAVALMVSCVMVIGALPWFDSENVTLEVNDDTTVDDRRDARSVIEGGDLVSEGGGGGMGLGGGGGDRFGGGGGGGEIFGGGGGDSLGGGGGVGLGGGGGVGLGGGGGGDNLGGGGGVGLGGGGGGVGLGGGGGGDSLGGGGGVGLGGGGGGVGLGGGASGGGGLCGAGGGGFGGGGPGGGGLGDGDGGGLSGAGGGGLGGGGLGDMGGGGFGGGGLGGTGGGGFGGGGLGGTGGGGGDGLGGGGTGDGLGGKSCAKPHTVYVTST